MEWENEEDANAFFKQIAQASIAQESKEESDKDEDF